MVTEQPERLIGERYRLRHVLGRGSMGIVWAAHDEVLRRDVAVKEVLRPPGTTDGEAEVLRERTMREARSVARLSHPNLVTLYDVVQLDGDPYVVMELVPSSSLADLIRLRGPLTLEQGAFSSGVSVTWYDRQDKLGPAELPTEGYTMVNLDFSYRLPEQQHSVFFYLRGQNLLDEDARRHTSSLKDVAPLPGRGIGAGVRMEL